MPAGKLPDLTAKYGLKPDPVLEESQLLSIDPITAGFVRLDTGQPPTLGDAQEWLAPIVLLPPVPEAVQRTFRIAKRLYLFGYFEYGFFTVSQHYAFLALEAAIHHRWVRTLQVPVLVQMADGRTMEFAAPTYRRLAEQWHASKRKLRVNGESFPNTAQKVLASLQAKHILTEDERVRIGAAMHLRNDLSHPEFASVFTPQPSTLDIVAELINLMFD